MSLSVPLLDVLLSSLGFKVLEKRDFSESPEEISSLSLDREPAYVYYIYKLSVPVEVKPRLLKVERDEEGNPVVYIIGGLSNNPFILIAPSIEDILRSGYRLSFSVIGFYQAGSTPTRSLVVSSLFTPALEYNLASKLINMVNKWRGIGVVEKEPKEKTIGLIGVLKSLAPIYREVLNRITTVFSELLPLYEIYLSYAFHVPNLTYLGLITPTLFNRIIDWLNLYERLTRKLRHGALKDFLIDYSSMFTIEQVSQSETSPSLKLSVFEFPREWISNILPGLVLDQNVYKTLHVLDMLAEILGGALSGSEEARKIVRMYPQLRPMLELYETVLKRFLPVEDILREVINVVWRNPKISSAYIGLHLEPSNVEGSIHLIRRREIRGEGSEPRQRPPLRWVRNIDELVRLAKMEKYSAELAKAVLLLAEALSRGVENLLGEKPRILTTSRLASKYSTPILAVATPRLNIVTKPRKDVEDITFSVITLNIPYSKVRRLAENVAMQISKGTGSEVRVEEPVEHRYFGRVLVSTFKLTQPSESS